MAKIKRTRRSILTLWHRRLGVAVALFVSILAITGLLLNHADRFAWMDARIGSDFLLDWYGLGATGDYVAYQAGESWVSGLGSSLYLGEEPLFTGESPLTGAVVIDEFVAVATRDQLLIAQQEPAVAIVDRFDSDSLPGPSLRLGTDDQGRLLLDTEGGLFRIDSELLSWVEVEHTEATWSEPARAPDEIREAVLVRHRGAGLPATRVVTDLHSGRIFGRYGPVVMDAAAIGLLALVVSGFVAIRLTPLFDASFDFDDDEEI